MQAQSLLHKIQELPPARIGEVEDFVDFLHHREEDLRLARAAAALSQEALGKVWDNDEDAVYDQL